MKHYFQPDQFTCVQTSAAILLSYFNIDKTPEQIISEVAPRAWPDKPDVIAGTPNQDIATYFLKLGFDVEIISYDNWITDQSWVGRGTEFIKKRFEEASGKLSAPMIGRSGSELYIQGYLDFINAGGKVSVEIAPEAPAIEKLLLSGPLLTTVSYNTLHGDGKAKSNADRSAKLDDVSGSAPNHNIVITKYEDDTFYFFDPWASKQELSVSRDRMIAAIATAQQECDNMLIVVRSLR